MKKFVFMSAAALIAQAGHAQSPDVEQPKVGLDSGAGTGVGIAIPRVSVKSDISGESVKITIGSAAETYSDAGLQSITASVSAPFDKDAGLGYALTDSGLPGTLSVDVNYSYSWMPQFRQAVETFRADRERVDTAVRTRCREKYKASGKTQAKCGNGIALSAIAADLRIIDEPAETGETRSADEIAAENTKDGVAVKLYDDFTGEQNTTMSSLSYHAISVSSSLGHDTFKYRDGATFAELKPKKTLYSFSAAYGFVPRIDRPWGFFLGGEYRRKYKLPDKETRCPVAIPPAVSVTCFNSPYGPPDRNTDINAFAAIRFDAGVGKKDTDFAFELKATYDAQDNDWGLSLPVYFLNNKDGKLSGGAKVSWDSENDDVTLGLFIGTTFDFLKL
jgi:hypothetical protein